MGKYSALARDVFRLQLRAAQLAISKMPNPEIQFILEVDGELSLLNYGDINNAAWQRQELERLPRAIRYIVVNPLPEAVEAEKQEQQQTPAKPATKARKPISKHTPKAKVAKTAQKQPSLKELRRRAIAKAQDEGDWSDLANKTKKRKR